MRYLDIDRVINIRAAWKEALGRIGNKRGETISRQRLLIVQSEFVIEPVAFEKDRELPLDAFSPRNTPQTLEESVSFTLLSDCSVSDKIYAQLGGWG